MVSTKPKLTLHRGRGRPRKFDAPSRAVTLTLPDATLKSLSAMDADISRAIVRLTEQQHPLHVERAPAELVRFGRRAVIAVQPSETLETRAGVELVPLPDGRALISFDQPNTIADLELTLSDVLDDPRLAAGERKVFEAIRSILKDARQSSKVTLLRRSIIVLEAVAHRVAPIGNGVVPGTRRDAHEGRRRRTRS